MALGFGFFLPVATTLFFDKGSQSGEILARLDSVVGVDRIDWVLLVLGEEVEGLLFGRVLGMFLSLKELINEAFYLFLTVIVSGVDS